jgi:beta-lactamase regulating signal transducer with metallopeptidase domain
MTFTLLSFLTWLFRTSLQAGAIAVIVWLLTGLLRNRLSASIRFGLWLLVFARLVLPNGIPLHLSLPQGPRHTADAVVVPQFQMPVVNAAQLVPVRVPSPVQVQTTVSQIAPAIKNPIPWTTLILAAWLAGVFIFALRALIGSLRLSRIIRTLPNEKDPATLHQVEQAAKRMGVRRIPRVLVAPENLGPALAGVWRAALLLPQSVELTPGEIRLILLHEMAHLRRNDVAVNCIVTLLTAMHWFNPFIWWAASRLREEREMACDEMVLACGNETAPSEYGQVLLKLIKPLVPTAVGCASTAVGLFETRHTFNRRISMIARYDSTQRPSRIFALVAVLLVGAVALTQAAGPATQPTAGNSATTPEQTQATAPPNYGLLGTAGSPGTPAQSPPPGGPMPQASTATAPIVVDTDPKATAAAYAALSRKLPNECRFNANGLGDVIDFLRDVSGANIFVDWGALGQGSIARDAPVTLKVKDVTLATAIGLVLQSASGSATLGFTVEGGVIRISTVDAGNKLVTEYYGPFSKESGVPNLDELERTILETIDPANYHIEKGYNTPSISVTAYQGKLIITTTASNQQRIGAMIQSLRENGGVTSGNDTQKKQ